MTTTTLGFSDAADSIRKSALRQHKTLRESASFGNQVALDELSEVWDECQQPGWDGYGALPVEQATLTAAYCVIDTLPYGFPLPTIGADPDGQLTLEWRKAPRRILSVSVDPDGYLHYAGLFGANKRFGTLEFFATTPMELLQMIRDL